MAKRDWFADESFWTTLAGSMFDRERIERAAGDVEKILAIASPPARAAVLDMPCGVGRHAIELARRGFAVTGVDLTRPFLERARDESKRAGVTIDFVESDMREFVRPDTFDLALCLFGSFGYFDDPADDRRVLSNFHRSLRPGGSLVLDMQGKESLAAKFRSKLWHEHADGTIVLEDTSLSDDWSIINTRRIVIDQTGRREAHFKLRLYSANELKAVLRDVRFTTVRCFGDFDQHPYDHTATRLVVHAVRA